MRNDERSQGLEGEGCQEVPHISQDQAAHCVKGGGKERGRETSSEALTVIWARGGSGVGQGGPSEGCKKGTNLRHC